MKGTFSSEKEKIACNAMEVSYTSNPLPVIPVRDSGIQHLTANKQVLNQESLPKHLAIIMDGNGRWANSQGKTKTDGYTKGGEVAYDIAKHCTTLTIPYLTLYAFSMENWLRPKDETDGLLDLFYSILTNEDKIKFFCDYNIKLNFIGNLSLLPTKVLDRIKKVEEITYENDGLLLTVAISYGAKQEIIHAVNSITQSNIGQISEDEFKKFLYTKDLPELDLLIRTGGEKRLSNFLLLQAAYAELHFCDTLWPDFSCQDLSEALEEYKKRKRRYGR